MENWMVIFFLILISAVAGFFVGYINRKTSAVAGLDEIYKKIEEESLKWDERYKPVKDLSTALKGGTRRGKLGEIALEVLLENAQLPKNIVFERNKRFEDDNYKEADKKPSKTLKKEIYVKEVKGLKMVKKFFVWETNVQSDEYPKYVFYKVDYSPSRANKLNRDIKVSNDKKQILNIFKDSIESDIKKGWNKY